MTRLLIVAPNWLGDAVMALPAIADVRRARPDAEISIAARPPVAALFSMVSDVNDVVGQVAETARSYDEALLLPNSFRSALDVRRAGIPQRWGYKSDGRGWLLTRAVARPAGGMHQVDMYQHLVSALGFATGSRQPHLAVPAALRAAGAAALADAGWDGRSPLVVLAPGAAFGRAKRWPPDYFADLVRVLAADHVRSVLVGSAADQPTAREIELALGDHQLGLLNLVGRTDVPTLSGLLTHARALVANDSGAMHLGAAIGIAVTAMFGPTDERLTAPRSASPHTVLTHPVWCRPCMLRECPLDHACLRGVSVADVAAATRRLM